jgi:hypothetical protein
MFLTGRAEAHPVEKGVEHRQEAEAALAKRESQAVELHRKL